MTDKKQDLSKIDFTKCRLPEWGNRTVSLRAATGSVLRIIASGQSDSVAYKPTGCGWIYGMALSGEPVDKAPDVAKICDAADNFIASELARLKLEEEFPMSADEARAFLMTHPGEHRFGWIELATMCRGETGCRSAASTATANGFRYRLIESRNVPEVKTEPKKYTTEEAVAWLREHPDDEFEVPAEPAGSVIVLGVSGDRIGSTYVPRESGFGLYIHRLPSAVPIRSDWTLTKSDWVTVWSDVAKLTAAGVTVMCREIGSGSEWAPRDAKGGPLNGYEYKVDRNTLPTGFELSLWSKSNPKLPTVKAPEGLQWENDGIGVALYERGKPLCRVFRTPDDRTARDAMAACVAAWDEANGKKPDAVEVLVTDVNIHGNGETSVAKVELFMMGDAGVLTDACRSRTVLRIAPR